MLANNNSSDYRFQTYDFEKGNGFVMDIGEALEKLQHEVIEAEENQKGIGFKP